MTAKAKEQDIALNEILLTIPNLGYEDVPDGDEEDNVEIHRWGTPPKSKMQKNTLTSRRKAGMDFETAGRPSGSRFVVLRGAIARIHRARPNL